MKTLHDPQFQGLTRETPKREGNWWSPARLAQQERMRMRTKRRLLIEQTYLESDGNGRVVAQKLGISRERVRQIVTRSKDPLVQAAREKRRWGHKPVDHSQEHCNYCGVDLGGLRYKSPGRCGACVAALQKDTLARRVYLQGVREQRHCQKCQVRFDRKSPSARRVVLGSGLCYRCFSKTPAFKERQRRWRMETPAGQRMAARSRLQLDDWIKKNPERVKESVRRREQERKERYANDPVYREKMLRSMRARYYRRRQQALQEVYGSS